MDQVDTTLCMHQPMGNNSHEFKMLQGNREAVQAWADHIEQLQLARQWYGKDHIRLLIDARGAVGLPIRYLFELLSDYNRAYPDLMPPKLTMAFVRSPDTVILDVYLMMAELFEPPLSVQFFIDEERAKRWLLESD